MELNDCIFECVRHYYLSSGTERDGECSPCNREACGIEGFYRDTCSQGSTADAACLACAPITGAVLGLPTDIYSDSCEITCSYGFYRNEAARLCCDVNAETDGETCVCLPGFTQFNEAVCLV